MAERFEISGFAIALLLAGCSGEGASEVTAAERGKLLYQNVCIACHHAQPARDGSLGPAVAGASAELIEAKVLRGEYPPGYAPRRPTQTMPKFEYLAPQLDELIAYLKAAEAES